MSTITAPTVAGGRRRSRTSDLGGPRFSSRRRVLMGGCAGFLILLALAANYGPLHEWRDARARLDKKQAQVTQLSTQKAQLEAQLKDLGDSTYLEGLARQELTYARPGEDVFIVSGLAGDKGAQGGTSPATGASAHKPGLLERFLSALGRLF